MKKLILLLFIPLISFSSFGQGFSLDDLKELDSFEKVKLFCFENGFAKMSDGATKSVYEKEIPDNTYITTRTMTFRYFFTGTWEIEFPKYTDGSSNTTFNDILNEVKRECEFRMVLEDGGEYICYSCPNSFFEKGLGNSYIGFKRKKSSDVVSIVLSID